MGAAQGPAVPYGTGNGMPVGPGSPSGMPAGPGPGPGPQPVPDAPAGLSTYITYPIPGCCGPIGGDGPIHTELYVRTGPSFPVEGEVFRQILDTGWQVEGGGRSLFFNPARNAAWTADLSISNIYNHAQPFTLTQIVPLNTPPTQSITPRALNRTYVNLALGREWYLNQPVNSCGWMWRAGFDVGGQWGTAKVDFRELPHATDTIYGTFVSMHTDVEKCCCGCCTFTVGLRLEWDYTWMDILGPPNNSDLQDVDLLMTIGVRY
jgi:hypothetical protein